jgi:hypothetical protein
MVEMRFDANDYKPSGSPDPIPAAWYKMAITDSDRKPNSKKTGSYLEFWFTVLEGEHVGRKVPARLNDDNPSAQCVEIAKGNESAICRSIGIMVPRDTVELHNVPLMVKVGLEKTDAMRNVILGYAPVQSQAAPVAPQAAAPAPFPAAAQIAPVATVAGLAPPVAPAGDPPPWPVQS